MDTLDCCQCFYLTPTLICAPDFQLVEGGHEDKNYAISLLKHWLLPFPAILSRSSTHPPSPCLYSPPGCHWGFHLRVVGASNAEADNQTQVSPLVTRMYLSPDAWWPWQEVIRWPSDLPWWPFLSPCCLSGRKDAVCCPQAPLSHSPVLSLTRETRLLIPGSSLLVLSFFYSSFSVCSILHLFLSCLSTHFIFFWHHPFLLLLLFPRPYEMWVNTADTSKPHRPRSHSITLRGLTSLLIYRLRFILFLTLIYLFVLLLFYCPYIHIKYGSQFMWWRTSKVRLLGLVCSKMKCMHTAD